MNSAVNFWNMEAPKGHCAERSLAWWMGNASLGWWVVCHQTTSGTETRLRLWGRIILKKGFKRWHWGSSWISQSKSVGYLILIDAKIDAKIDSSRWWVRSELEHSQLWGAQLSKHWRSQPEPPSHWEGCLDLIVEPDQIWPHDTSSVQHVCNCQSDNYIDNCPGGKHWGSSPLSISTQRANSAGNNALGVHEAEIQEVATLKLVSFILASCQFIRTWRDAYTLQNSLQQGHFQADFL